jgi:lipopolysaccharide/colanic/teichoic acid biosynthesis glycosyltransferase
MTIRNGVLNRASGRAKASTSRRHLHDLLEPEQVRQLLERERARSDRSGLGFCLAVFAVEDSKRPAASHALSRVARAVLRRARLTDTVGWLDARHVCALLPDTSAGGARHLASDVSAALAPQIPLDVRIYGYDVDFPAAADRRGGDFPPDESGPDGDAARISQNRPHSVPAVHPPGLRAVARTQEPAGFGPDGASSAPGVLAAVAPLATLHPVCAPRSTSLSPNDIGLTPELLLELSCRPVHPSKTYLDHLSPLPPCQPLTALPLLDDVEELLLKPLPLWKRLLDLLGASVALLLFSPIMLVSALAVKFTSHGPVIFKQPRAGLGGKPFTMFKFRSMVADAEALKADLHALNEQDGPAFKIKNDPRVTRIGKFLRKTSLDELPQLINVLKGEMTLVGPRPLPMKESDQCHRWHRRRLDVTPGLTCVWQVSGRSEVYFDEWMRMDMQYIRRRSLLGDLSLIVRTIPAVLLRRGAR